MRILVVSTSFPMRKGDSLSPFIWDYCRTLKERGWEITVLVPHHRGLPKFETWEGIEVRRFKYLPERFEDIAYSGGIMPGLKTKPWKALKMPFYILSMYSAARRILSEKNFDLVNFHWLFPACFWLKRFYRKGGIPVVLTGHGTDIRLTRKFPFSWFAKRAMKAAKAATVNSQYMAGILTPLQTESKIAVIPMGVDTVKFAPGNEKPSKSKKVLFIGRLIQQKGVDLLLDAFAAIPAEIPGSTLEIIGYGPLRDQIAARIESGNLTDSVILTDPVDYDDLADKYRSARILALPSLIPEGLGMTAIEAGASGVPTITFGLGGTSEFVISGENGIVTAADVSSLRDGLLELLRDDGKTDRLGENAHAAVIEKYSWGSVSGKFNILFRELAGK